MSLHLKIITPLSTVLDEEVSSIRLVAETGEMEVLPGHADMITALDNGELIYRPVGGASQSLFIGGGFLQVEHDLAMLVTDMAVQEGQINQEEIEAAIARAREYQSKHQPSLSREELARLEAIIAQQLAALEYNRRKRRR